MKYPRYKYVLLFLDLLVLLLSFIVGNLIMFGWKGTIYNQLDINFVGNKIILFLFSGVMIFLFHTYNLYKVNVFLKKTQQILIITFILITSGIILGAFSFFIKPEVGLFSNRLGITTFVLLSLPLYFFVRIVLFPKMFFLFSQSSVFRRNFLIIGGSKIGRLLAADSIFNDVGLSLVGFVDDDYKEGERIFKNYYNLGKISDLERICNEKKVDKIIICLDNVPHHILLDVIYRSKQTQRTVKIASPLFGIIENKMFLEKYGDISVIGVVNYTPSTFDLLKKRIFDFTTTLVALFLLSPLYILIGFVIKITSKGPIIFKQTRIGKDGKEFLFYKFRTMLIGSDYDKEREQLVQRFIKGVKSNVEGSTKIVDENKITTVGKFLRKTSLDELPQLINVLKGDMSLVGPRPCLPYEWEHYEEWHKSRLSVTPGCTGVWQVSGRSNVSFQDMVIMDLYYIYNYSFFLDLKVILQTIPVMIFSKGGK